MYKGQGRIRQRLLTTDYEVFHVHATGTCRNSNYERRWWCFDNVLLRDRSRDSTEDDASREGRARPSCARVSIIVARVRPRTS